MLFFDILENSANFNALDLEEILKSNNQPICNEWYFYYDIFRNCDYYSIAKIGDKSVGFLQAFSDRDNFATSYLYSLCVHKDYQNQGIGRGLMQAFNKKFAHTSTWSIIPKKFKNADSFLSKFGFLNKDDEFSVYFRLRY